MSKKLYFIIPFLILVLIFGLVLACGDGSESKEEIIKEEKSLATEIIPKTINVKYVVLGRSSIMDSIPPEVSVTYSNSQGGTEQINGIKLKKKPSTIGLSEIEDNWGYLGELIADYKNFPVGEFTYLSAQNQNDFGDIFVIILINGKPWRFSKAKGGYSIATANGYYEQ